MEVGDAFILTGHEKSCLDADFLGKIGIILEQHERYKDMFRVRFSYGVHHENWYANIKEMKKI